jgi:hypothetical protein
MTVVATVPIVSGVGLNGGTLGVGVGVTLAIGVAVGESPPIGVSVGLAIVGVAPTAVVVSVGTMAVSAENLAPGVSVGVGADVALPSGALGASCRGDEEGDSDGDTALACAGCALTGTQSSKE